MFLDSFFGLSEKELVFVFFSFNPQHNCISSLFPPAVLRGWQNGREHAFVCAF